MTTGGEFTEYDRAMVAVLDNLAELRRALLDHAIWLSEVWGEVSDEPMPYFELLEEDQGDGQSVCKAVFVLREDTLPTSLVEHFRQR